MRKIFFILRHCLHGFAHPESLNFFGVEEVPVDYFFQTDN
jgi:hypothetical protein